MPDTLSQGFGTYYQQQNLLKRMQWLGVVHELQCLGQQSGTSTVAQVECTHGSSPSQ